MEEGTLGVHETRPKPFRFTRVIQGILKAGPDKGTGTLSEVKRLWQVRESGREGEREVSREEERERSEGEGEAECVGCGCFVYLGRKTTAPKSREQAGCRDVGAREGFVADGSTMPLHISSDVGDSVKPSESPATVSFDQSFRPWMWWSRCLKA